MDRGFEKMDKRFGDVLQRMDRGFELIAKLIVEENDRTRKQILDALGK
jgi:hypothetical protein